MLSSVIGAKACSFPSPPPPIFIMHGCYRRCPDLILNDIGSAFSFGAVGGSAFHFLKGIYNSPDGKRMVGGVQAVRMNVTRVGGRFAVWGGLMSTLHCTMPYVRQKEDLWSSITAGAATGGFLWMRRGLGAACRSAMFGGVMLTVIDVGTVVFDRYTIVLGKLPQNSNSPAFRPPTPEAEA